VRMPDEIRFHLDEHVPPSIAAGLKRRGIDVTTTLDAGLSGADDIDHVSYALANGRVIYSSDEDYLILHHQGVAHAGIVFCRQGSRSIGEIIRFLVLIHACLTAEEIQGTVEFA
jgi:predicted nuclease of predicted toxin-antitoxin system